MIEGLADPCRVVWANRWLRAGPGFDKGPAGAAVSASLPGGGKARDG